MKRNMLSKDEIFQGRAARSLPFVLFIIFASEPAYAYIDPGSGGLIIQALIGAIVTAVVALKIYWRRLVAFLSRLRKNTSVSKGDS